MDSLVGMNFATNNYMDKHRIFLTFLLACVVFATFFVTAGCQPEPVAKTILGKWIDQDKVTWEFKKGGNLTLTQPGDVPSVNQGKFEILDELSFRLIFYPDTETPITRKVRYTLKNDKLKLNVEKLGQKSVTVFNLKRVVDGEAKEVLPATKPSKQLGLFGQTLRIQYADVYLATVLMRAVFKEINSLPGTK